MYLKYHECLLFSVRCYQRRTTWCKKSSFIITSQWFLTFERFLTTKCNILSVMNAVSPLPLALFCRVDMVLCMFKKNLQPPTQPSAITLCVGKYFSRTHAIRFLWSCRSLVRQLFLLLIVKVTNYSGENNKITFALLSHQFCSREVKMKRELWCCCMQITNLPSSLSLICCKRICGPGFGMAAVQGTKLPSTPYLFALDTSVVANLPQEDNISL